MGGAPGLLLASKSPIPLVSFLNVEGNLLAADCGIASRGVAETSEEDFRNEKYCEMLQALAGDKSLYESVSKCPADALHASAVSLVEWSDSGRLLQIFKDLSCNKLYLYGDKSRVDEVVSAVRDAGIPLQEVPDCGHMLAIDQ